MTHGPFDPHHTSPPDAGQENFGECVLCHSSCRRDSISTHLRACMQRKVGADAEAAAFHIRAESIGACLYWMNLHATFDATLEDLDRFLRKTWLEPCCGHLSGFHLGPVAYMHRAYAWRMSPDENVVPMTGVKLGQVLHPKAQMEHEYDFGTATHTRLRVIANAPALPGRSKIRALAQNGRPRFPCDGCAGTATLVCAGCFIEADATFCHACAKLHECDYDQEAFVPVVNSPRMGVCAYTGPNEPLRRTWVHDPDAETTMGHAPKERR